MKKLLWWLIAGSKGGLTRASIINSLNDRPANANQLTNRLDLDYKTIRHHLRVLDENGIITIMNRKKYGAIYFLSTEMERNYEYFQEIWEQIGEK
ncbi:MAG: winged helix-turn-helix domain-containing protein [Candidatus Thermoplasmatota archaeon]|nr:winged helix-turn-helix domain-containing protein [Candidatus Thermoplasmatota archaeon]